jgi:hypothetical protein
MIRIPFPLRDGPNEGSRSQHVSECSSVYLSVPTQLESATEAQVKDLFALSMVGCAPILVGAQGTVSARGGVTLTRLMTGTC